MKRLTYASFLMLFLGFAFSFAIVLFISDESKNADFEHTHLVAEHIYDSVHEKFLYPIVVAQTMASDSFLQDCLIHEGDFSADAVTEVMSAFLRPVRENNGFSAAFVISEVTRHQQRTYR